MKYHYWKVMVGEGEFCGSGRPTYNYTEKDRFDNAADAEWFCMFLRLLKGKEAKVVEVREEHLE